MTHRKRYASGVLEQLGNWIEGNWFTGVIVYLVAQFMFNKPLETGVGQDRVLPATVLPIPATKAKRVSSVPGKKQEAVFIPAENVSQFEEATPPPPAVPVAAEAPKAPGGVPGFSIRNLSPLLSLESLRKRGIPESEIQAKLQVCRKYVERYLDVAKEEMREYGIPASITLAQGLLESDAGESTLALQSNNHFGIKCRSRCLGCTCRNYSDDDIYDMFRVFESPGDSFREHSLLLKGERYRKLHKLKKSDYRGWAHGLKAAGYATDPRYAEKLIKIIEALALYKYDK